MRKKVSSSNMSDSETAGGGKKAASKAEPAEKPDWASGLKKFYDSVVDEPLPDTFQELLAKLDDGKA